MRDGSDMARPGRAHGRLSTVVTSEGSWAIQTVDGADVRLRSGRIGLVNVDVSAPVASGDLHATAEHVHLGLRLALDELRTGNFVVQAAARALVTRHDAHVLAYSGKGVTSETPWVVTGRAIAGNVDVEIALTITPIGPDHDPLAEIDIVGTASFGRVHLPLPGMGTVEDLSIDLDARLALSPMG